MKAGQIMIRKLSTVTPEDSVAQAATLMARVNAGILPVVKGGRIAGLVTDRDIVVRAVAAGKKPERTLVDDVMTEEVHYCLEDDGVEDVAKRMGALGVRRMPVCDREGALVGLISLDDVAAHLPSDHVVAEALRGIAKVSRAPRAV
jgi:CBS domain-containing protein